MSFTLRSYVPVGTTVVLRLYPFKLWLIVHADLRLGLTALGLGKFYKEQRVNLDESTYLC